MDFLGSSKKINRHVYKALRSSPGGLNFGKIDQFVKYCNRNLNPVGNITEKIANSLRNYERYGIVGRTGDNYHLILRNYKQGMIQQLGGWPKTDDHLHEKVTEPETCDENKACANDEKHFEDAVKSDVPETNCNVIAENSNVIAENSNAMDVSVSVNNEKADNVDGYNTKSLSSIPPPDLKRKKRKGLGTSDDDEENVESHRKRRKIITVLDGRAEIKQGNSAKNDPISYPEDILFMNSPPEANDIQKLDDSADHINVISSEEIIIAPTTIDQDSFDNRNQFDNDAECDLIQEIQPPNALFQRTHSYFYLN